MATKNLWMGSAVFVWTQKQFPNVFGTIAVQYGCIFLAICTSEWWMVHVLNVHHNLDRVVWYCPVSCSVKPVPILKWAAGGLHPPWLDLPPMGVFAFGQRPLAWSNPSPDAFPSGSGLYWILQSPAAEPGRGQADLLSAPRLHLSTRHCTCRQKKKTEMTFYLIFVFRNSLENIVHNNILTSCIKFLWLT